MLNFKGGIKPDAHKYTKNTEVVHFPLPSSVRIFAYGDDISVNRGDEVKIGDSLTVNHLAHSSVCGKVTDISNGYVTVTADEKDREAVSASAVPFNKKLSAASFEDIYSFTASKGICFGDTFLHKKLEINHTRAKILLVNCAETAPFLCTAYNTLASKKKEIVYGTKIIMRALGIKKAAITIEKTNRKALKEMKALLESTANIEVISQSSKYPFESPLVLKRAFLNKYVTQNKDIKTDNIMVISCEEASALFEAFKTGLPMVNKLITVDGDAVNSPHCLSVPIGTSLSEVLEFCEFDETFSDKIIEGNPIMGKLCSPDSSVSKETNAIIALSKRFFYNSTGCISCGRCRSACPVRLDPAKLLEEKTFSAKCINCGCCAYICPARLDFSVISTNREVTANE